MNMPQDTNIYTALPERKGGGCKKPEDVSHFRASIRHAKDELSGFSRIAGEVSPEVRQAVFHKSSTSAKASTENKSAGQATTSDKTPTPPPSSSTPPTQYPKCKGNSLSEQYSPRRWSAMYCDRNQDIEKIAEGFRKADKPFEVELLEFSRSYIAKPSMAVDAAAPTSAKPSKPGQMRNISTSLKKEQLKESKKSVATVDTKPDNPNAATKGQMPTPWMDIAMKERFQQEVRSNSRLLPVPMLNERLRAVIHTTMHFAVAKASLHSA